MSSLCSSNHAQIVELSQRFLSSFHLFNLHQLIHKIILGHYDPPCTDRNKMSFCNTNIMGHNDPSRRRLQFKSFVGIGLTELTLGKQEVPLKCWLYVSYTVCLLSFQMDTLRLKRNLKKNFVSHTYYCRRRNFKIVKIEMQLEFSLLFSCFFLSYLFQIFFKVFFFKPAPYQLLIVAHNRRLIIH